MPALRKVKKQKTISIQEEVDYINTAQIERRDRLCMAKSVLTKLCSLPVHFVPALNPMQIASLRYCLSQMNIDVLGNALNILNLVYEHVMDPFKWSHLQDNYVMTSPPSTAIKCWNQSECARTLFRGKLLKPMPQYDEKMFTFSNRLYIGCEAFAST